MRQLVGRDVLGTPRTGNAHAARTRTPGGRGPPGTSAPTTNACADLGESGIHRLVGRDVLGAPRTGDAHAVHTRTPQRTRAAEDVGPYHKRPRDRNAPVPTSVCPGCTSGRARRPRRAAHRKRPLLRYAHGDVSGDTGRRGRRPLPQTPPRPQHTRTDPGVPGMCQLVGRDVLGAPRTGNAHPARTRTSRETRAAGDVGPYHKRPRDRNA